MTAAILRINTPTDLADLSHTWHSAGLKIGLVPTMGALHHGHLSLIDRIRPHVDKVVVSIFVNPTQFGVGEDFEHYPRNIDRDMELLAGVGADAVYTPTVEHVYQSGFATSIEPGAIAARMEGAHRPGHFNGVATVVVKLINQARADIAIFGEKDYQQLAVIRQTMRDLDVPVSIMGAPIAREPDGLAASSRNMYLSTEQRLLAGQINKIMRKIISELHKGLRVDDAVSRGTKALLDAGFDAVDYFEIVDADTLLPQTTIDGHCRLITTVRIGKVRLLDNMAI